MARRKPTLAVPAAPAPTGRDVDIGDMAVGELAPAPPALPEALGPLTAGCLSRFRTAFPRPGQAMAATGLVLASATMASLGLVAVHALPSARGAEASRSPVGSQLLAAGVAETLAPAIPPPPAPEGGKVAGSPEAPPALPPAPSPPDEELRLSRVSDPTVAKISSPPLVGPPTDPVGPAPAPAPAGLSRLSHSEVLASLAVPEAVRDAVVPTDAGALPLGKGMWLYIPEEIEGGDINALVARAQQVGLTHVYVRTGSSRAGFYAQNYLDQLLPKAHAAGIRVYGWDFTYLDDVDADVARSVAAITYTTPSGDRIDGFAADIETTSEGTNLTAEGAAAYGYRLREAVGTAYPLVAVVPRPSPLNQARYPYAAVIPPFDAVAPMTYWLNRQPDTDVVNDVSFLAPFGKPVVPIGQAYDGFAEGGRSGPPPPEEIQRFMAAAEQVGAAGASFWSWQDVTQAIWDTIQAAPEFRWEAKPPEELRADQVRALQVQLTHLGHPVAASGGWDDATTEALGAYQERAHLPPTGVLDTNTLAVLLRPFNPPVRAPAGG
ncbi:MAG: peptidoglycan-binding domain-containing protein [Acidimicrobiales bacterium]